MNIGYESFLSNTSKKNYLEKNLETAPTTADEFNYDNLNSKINHICNYKNKNSKNKNSKISNNKPSKSKIKNYKDRILK